MEVPGKREDPDLEKGSQGNTGKFCHPCGCDGKYVPAEAFCQTCGDYLCARCSEVHTIPLPMRNHVLLDKASMPVSALETKKLTNVCTIICPDHHDQVMEFFCPTHITGQCGVCTVMNHKQCDTVYIPTAAEGYKESKEFANLVETLKCLDADIKTLSSDIKEAISSVKDTSAKAIQDIRQFRKVLNDYLDKKEQELVLVTKKREQGDTKLLQDLTDELEFLKNENTSFMKQLKSVDTEICDLYVTSKQMMKTIQSVHERFVMCIEKNKEISYTFDQGNALKDLLASNTDFGEIKRSCQPKNKNILHQSAKNIDFTSKQVERRSDIEVKMSGEKNTPRITGMALLSAHKLLLADCNNDSVKTLDTTSYTILSRLSLSGNPWNIALLPLNKAAVTLPGKENITIISTKDKLSVVRTVNVDGSCYGISATMYNLIVSFIIPKKIDIMNSQGNVIVSVTTDRSGQALFSGPWYNTTVLENSVPVIYVSDYSKNSITKLSVGGQVLSTYTHKKWSGLEGLTATRDGQLLVCNGSKHTVDVISKGGKGIQTLLDSTHGIKLPESICYSAEQNMLYVSSYSDNTVQAYKFV